MAKMDLRFPLAMSGQCMGEGERVRGEDGVGVGVRVMVVGEMCEWVIQHLCLIPSACMLVSVTPLCLRTCIHIRRFSSFWIRNMGLGKCFGRGSLAGG